MFARHFYHLLLFAFAHDLSNLNFSIVRNLIGICRAALRT